MIKILSVLLTISLLLFAKNNKYTNSLIDSYSPYLLQHAHNPVNWKQWNKNTLQEARKQNKLIFLSIGYSTCHWCHVMEKESFSNENIAKLLNKNYISIKIDKELRGDLDIYYQNILSKLKTKNNGWPLTVILTPKLDVLYITTYIPPTFKYNTQGLDSLLLKYSKLYKNKKELKKIIEKNNKIINSIIKYKKIKLDTIENIYIDSFNQTPKFPRASNLLLMYDLYDITKNHKLKTIINNRLTTMAKSGMYDQIDGMFFRYSTNIELTIPHFEKMLYTTAQLIPLYSRGYSDTKKPLYKHIVIQSINEVENKFLHNNLFYSAIDADNNHIEGRYFLYSYKSTYNYLLKNDYTKKEILENLEYLDIYEDGNFDNIFSNVNFTNNDENKKKPKKISNTLKLLQKMRKIRDYPFIDKKYLLSWNAMMIKAYLSASQIDIKYQIKGLQYLNKLLNTLYINSKLYHYKIDGKIVTQDANLEDYSYLIDTLIYAYLNTYDNKYIKIATKLYKKAQNKFYINNRWYLSMNRLKIKANLNDKYYPSALALMFLNQITLANINYDMKLLHDTKQTIKKYKNRILSDIQAHPISLMAVIRLKKGDIILKSNIHNLKQKQDEIRDIKYPFLLISHEKIDQYLACDENGCFGFDKDFNKIKNTIIKRLKQNESN
jgi:uncharacterized protein YyaL (SSP411 family)